MTAVITSFRSRLERSDLKRVNKTARKPIAVPTLVAATAAHCMHMTATTNSSPTSLILVGLSAIAITLTGCGGMDAESFAERIREQGVQMQVGEELRSEQEGLTVYDFRIPPIDSTSAEARGTLEVFESDEMAREGWTRCLAAADLTCYRAGPVVVVLPSDGLEARRLAAAMQRLEK